MTKYKALLLTLALSTITSGAIAQDNDQNTNQMNNQPMQSQPAPIERSDMNSGMSNTFVQKMMPGQLIAPEQGTASVVAAPGVFFRVAQGSAVRAVKLTNEDTELTVDRGVINVSVHSAMKRAQILIDLPGGQTDLIKDGFYTFNANTNTVRVLKGEAYGYPGHNTQQKPIKIKENHAVVFNGPDVRSFEFDPFEARADLIPYGRMGAQGPGQGPGYYGPGYYGPYAGYPYYDYGYPYYYDPFFFGYYGWGWGGGWGGGWRGGGGWHGGGGGWGGGGHGGGGRH